MTRVLSVLVGALLAGCLDVPSGPEAECSTTSDCDSASGEVCDEGVCWGNPPQGMYAVVISPPSSRKDLVPRELITPKIAPDGWLSDLTLDKPSVFTGRIEAMCVAPLACDRTAIATTITITRPSSFKGGPGFKVVAESDATTDPTGPSFEIAIPKTSGYDQPYTVTVVPTGRGDEPSGTGTSPAELYPPTRFTLTAKDNTITQTIPLGGANLPTIYGSVVSALGNGLSHYRVVALGRWEAGAPPTEVSTVGYTGADGKFRLVLSDRLVGPVEVVAKPPPNGLPAPTLHVYGVSSSTPSQQVLTQPANLGATKTFTFPVKGVDGSGQVKGGRGARVQVKAQAGTATTTGVVATFTAEDTSDDSGNVTVTLLDGAAFASRYKLEIVPPASSSMGVLYDVPLDLASQTAPLLLPTRMAIRGQVHDVEGHPLEGVSVTARASLRFIWSFDDSSQPFVSSIPAATTTTPETGEFALWVDPTVGGLWGHYDLAFDPASKARAPTWVKSDIEIPRDSTQTTVSLGEVALPDAAAIRGMVLDAAGVEVEGAEVKIFRMSDGMALCSEVLNAPVSCPIPAVLQGRGASDAAGVVRLTVPR